LNQTSNAGNFTIVCEYANLLFCLLVTLCANDSLLALLYCWATTYLLHLC
jgi:hypothetical protein